MNTFTLKMTALILMVLDHIGCYFDGAPVWLNWLGRLSYPLFLFCMVQGSNIFSISFTRPYVPSVLACKFRVLIFPADCLSAPKCRSAKSFLTDRQSRAIISP